MTTTFGFKGITILLYPRDLYNACAQNIEQDKNYYARLFEDEKRYVTILTATSGLISLASLITSFYSKRHNSFLLRLCTLVTVSLTVAYREYYAITSNLLDLLRAEHCASFLGEAELTQKVFYKHLIKGTWVYNLLFG